MADREISSLEGALRLLDEWQEAYAELEQANTRLLLKYRNSQVLLGHARAAIDNDLHPPEIQPVESECPF